jgi:hypothetical protein
VVQVKWLSHDEREWLLYKKAIDSGSAGEAEEVSKKCVFFLSLLSGRASDGAAVKSRTDSWE